MNDQTKSNDVLDLRGLNCPLPVLKTRKALRQYKQGDRLWVETTDPLATLDIPAFCKEASHLLVSHEDCDGFQRFLIEKGG